MYQEKYQFEKKKKGGNGLKIAIIVMLTLLLLSAIVFTFLHFSSLNISADENNAQNINNDFVLDNGYTEINGYSLLEISEDNPDLIFENISRNTHYLEYQIFDEEDNLIYNTAYLSPGEKDYLNAYEYFEPGLYSLQYRINIYDETFTLTSGTVTIIQDIEVMED